MYDELLNEENLTRKEREKLFKRKEILNAAVKIFAKKGFDHSTLDEIAELAEFGKGTIYNYFENKRDIYLAIIENAFNDYLSSVDEVAKKVKTFREFITNITRGFLEYGINNKEVFSIFSRDHLSTSDDVLKVKSIMDTYHNKITKLYEKFISSAIKNKEIKQIVPNIFVLFHRSIILTYIHHFIFENLSVNIEKEAESILDILFNGILYKPERSM
ncbi:MAG: TetR/AcrR family transcriptional regulator [Ignavibacteriales bacterium]|nr:TetR/AcrR family transcriptional regulator [Ignavibacteriales bacterium]